MTFGPLLTKLEHATAAVRMQSFGAANDLCPRCCSPLWYIAGKRGPYLGCSDYPQCSWSHSPQTPAAEPWAFLLQAQPRPWTRKNEKPAHPAAGIVAFSVLWRMFVK